MSELNPQTVPGHPEAAVAESTGEMASSYISIERHKAGVKERNRRGCWFDAGHEWPGVLIRVRPMNAPSVDMATQAYRERLLREDSVDGNGEKLTPEGAQRYAAFQAAKCVTGIQGAFVLGDTIVFSSPADEDEIAAQRSFLSDHFLNASDLDSIDVPLRTRISERARECANLVATEINRLGKDYVHGRAGNDSSSS